MVVGPGGGRGGDCGCGNSDAVAIARLVVVVVSVITLLFVNQRLNFCCTCEPKFLKQCGLTTRISVGVTRCWGNERSSMDPLQYTRCIAVVRLRAP